MMENTAAQGPLVFRFRNTVYDFGARTHIMGILNVTPDSFSDGGRFLDPERAVVRARAMLEEGADFIDVGGESSRPRGVAYGEGAEPVDTVEELRRVIPVIERVAALVPVSVDTTKSEVAVQALAAGAVMVNDISGFRSDPAMAEVIGVRGASAVVMHMRGTPKTMQADPHYDNVLAEVEEELRVAVEKGRAAGIRQIIVDPGIGFAKRRRHNLEILRRCSWFHRLGCPVMVGPSRKAFIGEILDLPVDERLEGTLAAVTAAILSGAHIVRVHDVKQVKRAALVADALRTPA
jgi:dihydropteroate synthase